MNGVEYAIDGSSTTTAIISTSEETCYKDANHPVSFLTPTPTIYFINNDNISQSTRVNPKANTPTHRQNNPEGMENRGCLVQTR